VFPVAAAAPYFLYFSLILLLAIYGQKRKIQSKDQTIFFITSSLIMVLFTYKGEYSDWRTYRRFVSICDAPGCTYFESFYDFITYISAQTFGFYLIPSLLVFLFTLLLISHKKVIKENSIFLVVSLSITFAFLALYYGALRQAFSFIFLLFALIYFTRKKYLASASLSIVATGFHLSSAVIIFVSSAYYLTWRITRHRAYMLMAALFTSYVVGILVLREVSSYLAVIDSFNPGMQNATDPGILRQSLLVLERLALLSMSFSIIGLPSLGEYLKLFTLLSLSGSIFYLMMFPFSLITAGRTVAFYRLADIFVVYYFFRYLFNYRRINLENRSINLLSLLIVLIYSVIKYYFTIVAVGFFR